MGNLNVLSDRYATSSINDIFSKRGKVLSQRELWIAVMKAQNSLGMDIPSEDITKFERAKEDIDLDRIEEIERKTKHDVKANIEAFIEVAGAGEYLHVGMTSRDLTDNVEQMQIKEASDMILGKYVSILRHLDDKAHEYSDIVMSARTHHQHAQPTLLGRRFSMWAEELHKSILDMESFMETYPLRGIKGPVGTQFDMLNLFGSTEKVEKLEENIAEHLGFSNVLESPGQVYPRSLDQKLINNLEELATAPDSYATTLRLMSGEGLTTEGFSKKQSGSSAMPHKMNTRSSERINGFVKLLRMYSTGASINAGAQWEEADVSCSSVRRVIIPDSFYASDGLCETTLTVLNDMGAYESNIGKQLDTFMPFLATTEILMAAVKEGIGREKAHKKIKEYATSEARRMMEEGSYENNLSQKLGNDKLFREAGLTEEKINSMLGNKMHFVGRAKEQIYSVSEKVNEIIAKYPEKAAYEPSDIL